MVTDARSGIPGFADRAVRYRTARIRYLAAGAGPPVVLVHGFGGAAANWRLIAPALATERRVLVPELPGHGGSSPLPAAPTLDPYADAVLAVLEAEDALPAAWVGHSLGALVGLRAAIRRPEAVTGIVLAAAAGISSALPASRTVVGLLGVLQPGRRVAPYRRRLSRSRLGAHAHLRLVGRRRPCAVRPGDGGGVPRRPRGAHRHRLGGQGARRRRPAARARARPVALPLPLGRERQLGAAPRRHGVRAPAAARRSGRSPTAVTC